jgi:hypothetical protein
MRSRFENPKLIDEIEDKGWKGWGSEMEGRTGEGDRVVAISWLHEAVVVYVSTRTYGGRWEEQRGAEDCGGSEALFAPEIRLSLVDYNRIKTDDVIFNSTQCPNLVAFL